MPKRKLTWTWGWAVALGVWLGGAGWAHGADRALIVGIETYEHAKDCGNKETLCVPPTLGGVDDADTMARWAQDSYGFSFSNITVLKGPQATAQAIANAMQALIRDTGPGDRVFFFFSGHGAQLPDDGQDETDRLDEVIAPYDVTSYRVVEVGQDKYRTRNVIRDDQFNSWVKQMSGRRVVMIFDSCHSGTISRASGDTGKYLLLPEIAEFKRQQVFSSPQGYSPVPTDWASRDLFVASEIADAPPKDSSIVFITAAQAYQKAFPIEVYRNHYQGSLVYALTKVHSEAGGTLPSVNDLEQQIRSKLEQLGPRLLPRQPLNDQEIQLPSVEIVSGCAIGSESLFELPTAATCQLDNSAKSDLRVELNFRDSKPVYFYRNKVDRDEFKFTVRLNQEAYLYLLVFSTADKATCLFPYNPRNQADSETQQTKLKPGTHNFPLPGTPPFTAQDPPGRDVWVALATKRPLKLCRKLDYQWDELFRDIGLARLQHLVEIQRQRGVGLGEPSAPLHDDEWQTAIKVLETRRKP